MPRKIDKESTILCRGNKSTIMACEGWKMKSEFWDSWSPFGDKKVIYCKDCCKQMFEYYLKETNSVQCALYYTLQKIDVPFIKEIYEQINKLASSGDINGKKTPITISGYMNALQRKTTMKGIWTDFSVSDVNLADINSKIQTAEVKKSEMEQFEINWGKQDTVEDYRFLENTFDRYTDGVTFDNQIQIDKYRDLCLDRLKARKIQEKRDDKSEDLNKVLDRIDKEMRLLNVANFNSNKPKTLSEQSMFEKLKFIKENNVADVYSEPSKYYDRNEVEKYIKDMCLRPTLNVLVNKNDFDIKFDDLDKYDL